MKQYTKQALAQSLKKLMQEKPVDKITVKELVDDCGINRQTFYYHFQDIYDLLGYIYETEAIEAIDEKRSYRTWQQGLHEILAYVSENRKICINTYRSLAREHLESFLNSTMYRLLGDVLKEVEAGRTMPTIRDDQIDFIIKFYGYAFSGTLLEWIATGLSEPMEELERKIETTMKGSFARAIRNFAGHER